MKKPHFKFYWYIKSKGYPYEYWWILLRPSLKSWIYSLFYSLIFGLIFTYHPLIILIFFWLLLPLYYFHLLHFIYTKRILKISLWHNQSTIILSIGRLFGLEPINHYYEPIADRKYLEKNVLDYEKQVRSIWEKIFRNRFLSPQSLHHIKRGQ